MKSLLKKLLPPGLIDTYHRLLSQLAAAWYGYPSEKMVVIGVTGTNGKTTVCNLIVRVLEEAGHKVGMTTTANFSIAGKEWLNDTKMTMLGRFQLQKLLSDMVKAGCTHAVIETSSQGIEQHRHAGINYDGAVFTNLTPEHIESHGGFENYKQAKGKLFAKLTQDLHKTLTGKKIPKVIVANLGDSHADFFLHFNANKKYGYLTEKSSAAAGEVKWPLAIVKALNVVMDAQGSHFTVRDVPFSIKLPGLYNIENAMAAVAVGLSQEIPLETISAGLAKVEGVPGRFEFINEGQPFLALVDYAPEPESFRKLYEAVAMLPKNRIIHVLGSCGGGRDRDRRPILGRLAAERADIVIVTNEDPYDDEPMEIIREVAAGASTAGKKEGENLFLILDRREALEKAVSLAAAGDLVIATGKGAEQAIMIKNGGKIPWDERVELRHAIKKHADR